MKLCTEYFLLIILLSGAIAFADTDVVLDKPLKTVNVDIMEAMKNRKTERSYTDKLISIQHLSTVLWAAYGINRQDGKRTVPTAYGKDYMEIFVFYNDRSYKYIPEKNVLQFIQNNLTTSMASTQGWVGKSKCVIVIALDMNKFPFYVGTKEEKLRLGNTTAGCIAQNVYLISASLQIGTCLVAGVNEAGCKKALKLNDNEIPLFVMPLGYIAGK